jgi:predicted O-linked N-acetylglucosamine transferase (SPINDLY family)
MLLTALGTPEQAETTVDGYVARCLALVADADDLAVRRAALRSRMKGSPLCDGASFARAMEQAYRQMWRSRCDGRN